MSDVDEEPTEDASPDYPMTTSQRIHAVMASIGDVGKDQENKQQGYNFRGIESMAWRVRDAMVAHGLICIPTRADIIHAVERPSASGGIIRTTAVQVTYAFMSADDSDDVIEAQMVGEANDTYDKAMTKALTAAQKYLLLQSYSIGDSGSDGDAQSPGADRTDRPADKAELEACRAALEAVAEEDRIVVREWCKRMDFGSLRNDRVRGELVQSFIALCESLSADVDDFAASSDAPY